MSCARSPAGSTRILSEGGLGPALRILSRHCAIPVELDISTSGRFTDRIEATDYYVVSEVLANAVKHARATFARVAVEQMHGTLRLSLRDYSFPLPLD